ncbi:LysR family transcriptional regulator [Roseibium sp.]|uniref:LysR family transcriptional regulator n=1 Tax=Roseibium sp. TaxID=1936156 RepID=UPI0026209964|nr:LysR family transcriptional regulator [Roseibium sp.]
MVHDFRTIGLPAMLSFHTVARLGGISAAADHLSLAKSGVSRHVSQLETHFGIQLLERGGRSVKLTPIGIRLDHRIRSILAEVDLLDDIAREEGAGISGQVTITTTPDFGRLVASTLFPAACKRHPDLSLVMRTAYAFEDMQDPSTDIAFRIGLFKDDRLVVRELGAFRFFLVASPELARTRMLTRPEDLADLPCLTFRADRPRSTWTFHAPDDQATVEVAGPIAVQSFDILLQLAIAGEGYALLPEIMLGDALESGALVRCLPDHASRPYPVFLTYRPGARRVARVDATVALAEELIPLRLSDRRL